MTEPESRELAHDAARFCRDHLKMSAFEFEELIENNLEAFAQGSIREAISQVMGRGEMPHLVMWTFFPMRSRMIK